MSDVIQDDKQVKVPTIGEEVRKKSFSQIIIEGAKEDAKREQSDSTPPPVEAVDNQVSEEDEKRKKEEAELEAAKKEEADREAQRAEREQARLEEQRRVDEIAKKTADELKAREDEERRRELKAEEDRKRQEQLQNDLIPIWEREGRQPKDYTEIAFESKRIAKLETLAELEARESLRREEEEKRRQEEQIRQTQVKQAQESFSKQLQRELDEDLTDLYKADRLPKIKDPNNPSDEGLKEQKRLFETAAKVNKERLDKGLPPIRSIKVIYYEHFKPKDKPAGHDAPVQGNSQPTTQQNADKFNWSRDHKKSMREILAEEKARMKRALLNR